MGLTQAFVVSIRAGSWSTVNRTKRLLSSCTIVATISGALALLFATATPSLPASLTVTTIALGAISAVLLFVTNVAMISRELNEYNVLRSIPPLLTVTLIFIVWQARGLSVPVALNVQTLVSALVCVIGFALVIPLLNRLTKSDPGPIPTGENLSSSLIRYWTLGISYHGTALLGLVVNNFDKFALAFLGGAYQMGLYTAAYSLSRAVPALQNSLGTVIFSKLAGTGPKDAATTETTLRVYRLTFMPTLLLALLLGVLSHGVIELALGSDFGLATVPFTILCIEAAFGGASWLLAQQFNAQGKPSLVLARQALSMIPLVGLVWFIPTEEAAVGLSLLMLASSIVRLCVTLHFFRRHLRVTTIRHIPSRDDIAQIIRLFRTRKDPRS